jgi:hypothetical protein
VHSSDIAAMRASNAAFDLHARPVCVREMRAGAEPED